VKVSLKRVQSKQICVHLGKFFLQNGLEVGDAGVEVIEDEMERKVEYHLRKGRGLEKVRR